MFVDEQGSVLETVKVSTMKTNEIVEELTKRGFRLKSEDEGADGAPAPHDEL